MDYFVCRALEVGRMSKQQIENLHGMETDRCLMPFEIQAELKLGTLKDRYGLPVRDQANALDEWHDRVKETILAERCLPYDEENKRVVFIGELDVEDTHGFDWKVHHLVESEAMNFQYSTGIKKLSETL